MLTQGRLHLHEQLLMRFTTFAGAAILWMAALFTSPATAAPEGVAADTLYERLASLNVQLRDASAQARGTAVVRRYRQLTADTQPCTPAMASGFSADDLFRGAAFAELYSLETKDVDTLGCLYRALVASGIATDWHARTYAGALTTVSRFAEANALRAQTTGSSTPILPQLEVSRDATAPGWRMLSLKDAEHARVETWQPASHRMHVVAVVHPTCAYSVRALSEIEQRPELQWLRDDMLLVVPPDASLPTSGLLAWNAAHPRLQMHPMYLRSDWEALTSLDTPTFYLVRDGQVLSSFEGWPNAKGLAALRAAAVALHGQAKR